MADAVVKRLTTRKIAEIKDEKAARAACLRLSKQGFGCVAMQPQS